MNHPKHDEKLLVDTDNYYIDTSRIASLNYSQPKEIYTITQEVNPKIGILAHDQGLKFKQLLKEFADLFAKDITQLGRTDLVMHNIYTEDIPR